MLVIKIEMWPKGDESQAIEFGRAYISNDIETTGRTNGEFGDYTIELQGGIYNRPELYHKTWKRGKLIGFNRKKEGAWHLLFKGIIAAMGSNKNG